MNLNHTIRLVSVDEILPLRQNVLKPFLTAEENLLPEDRLPSTYHWGLFIEDQLASVATFMSQSHPQLSGKNPYRLRGMATSRNLAGRGLGSVLLKFCENELQKKEVDLLWFNARIKAFPFYERLGFLYEGPLFDFDRIGPHKVMYKFLNPR